MHAPRLKQKSTILFRTLFRYNQNVAAPDLYPDAGNPKIPAGNPLDEARDAAREQISAAWQLHIEKIQDLLEADWRPSVDRVLRERFAELAPAIAADADRRARDYALLARREMSDQLSLAVRRLRQFESEAQWCMALLDGAIAFCSRTALIHVGSQAFRLLADRGPAAEGSRPDEEIPFHFAPALSGAVEATETIVTIRAASELSVPIAEYFGEDVNQRVHIFPVSTSQRVVALLYAEPGERAVDTGALELLATVAGTLLEGHLVASESRRPSNVVAITSAPQAAQSLPLPVAVEPVRSAAQSWSALSGEDQDLHLKAQRFARVKVAEMRLYKSAAVRGGRAGQNLYAALRDEIDGGREAYREQFLALSPTMLDYFHVELVRTLANDDAALLGPEYPGSLA